MKLWWTISFLAVCLAVAVVACSDSTCEESATCAASSATPTNEAGAPGDGSTASDASEGGASVDANPCDGGQSFCGGACVDVSAEAKHCGRCDHACIGTTKCVAGKCEPYTVISGQAIDSPPLSYGGRIFFTAYENITGGKFRSVNLDGSDLKTHFDVNGGGVCGQLQRIVDSAYLVCDSPQRIVRACPLPGCPSTAVIDTLPAFSTFTRNGALGKIYYTTPRPSGQTAGGGVFERPPDTQLGAALQQAPTTPRIVNGYVYWLNTGLIDPSGADYYQGGGGIFRVKLTNLSVQETVGSTAAYSELGALAVDDKNAYCVGRVGQSSTFDLLVVGPGGILIPIATNVDPTAEPAIDATNVYFGNKVLHALQYCSRADNCKSGPQTLVNTDATFVSTDDESVMFRDNNKNLMRVTKP